jgi:hypothetical protein
MLLRKLAPYPRIVRIQNAERQCQIYVPIIAAQMIGSVGVKHAEMARQDMKFS